MGSPSGQHARLQEERLALRAERDAFTKASFDEIFKCFKAINESRQVVADSIAAVDRIQGIVMEVTGELQPDRFQSSVWSKFQDQLGALEKSIEKEKVQRKKAINSKILKLLRTNISQETVVRLVTNLKEQARGNKLIPLESLPSIFLQCREVFIAEEILRRDPMGCDPAIMFQRTCQAMRGPVLSVLVEYSLLFEDLKAISAMLCKRFLWFLEITVQVIESTAQLSELGIIWNDLVALEREFKAFDVSFMQFIENALFKRAVDLTLRPLDKALALFIANANKTVVPETATSKSIPAFIMLLNTLNQIFKDILVFSPPALLDLLDSNLEKKFKAIEKALSGESSNISRIRAIYEQDIRAHVTGCLSKIREHALSM